MVSKKTEKFVQMLKLFRTLVVKNLLMNREKMICSPNIIKYLKNRHGGLL